MHPRQEGIHNFLNEYNNILGEFLLHTKEYPPNDFNAWIVNQRVRPGRRKVYGDIKYYHHIYNNLPEKSNDKHTFNRILGAKFVYVKNISLRNFIIGLFFLHSKNINCTVVKLPSHSDLKEFLVPEELANLQKEERFFELNWIN